MAIYVNLTITRRIKIQDPLPEPAEQILETLEDNTSVEYPADCNGWGIEEIDGSVKAVIEDAK